MLLAQAGEGSWWARLQQLAEPPPALQRATRLLRGWLELADKLPVHDLLDRIYFEGDVLARYTAVLPSEMRAKVVANLHAFMEIALSVDAGRYPSLPRFLQELRELRDSSDDAPDEGQLGTAGNAVRIYTVHEAKGLEAPIVWLLDANAGQAGREGNDVLLDWPNDAPAPVHFSMYADLASRGSKRVPLFEQEAALQQREEMNLLYVAMTRAQQALIVSGNGNGRENKTPSWYDRIAEVVSEQANPLQAAASQTSAQPPQTEASAVVELPPLTPVGQHAARISEQQQHGIRLHALLQHLTDSATSVDAAELMQRLGVPDAEMASLQSLAQQLIARPELQRYFDAGQYRRACNEMPYVNAQGELKRIDRLVEFDDEVWVLDYKTGEAAEPAKYRAQMAEYRSAMQAVYSGKPVRCALLFGDGILCEIE